MRRLFIAAIVLLAGPAQADDRNYPQHQSNELSIATEKVDNRIIPSYGPERGMRCGRTRQSCVLNFAYGKMSIEGYGGILPNQVISASLEVDGNASDPMVIMLFVDSKGNFNNAYFELTHPSDARHLISTILAFKSGKSIGVVSGFNR